MPIVVTKVVNFWQLTYCFIIIFAYIAQYRSLHEQSRAITQKYNGDIYLRHVTRKPPPKKIVATSNGDSHLFSRVGLRLLLYCASSI